VRHHGRQVRMQQAFTLKTELEAGQVEVGALIDNPL
jgi:hypothetical protein